MNNHLKRLAGISLWGALAVASPARAADANAIRSIDVAEQGGAVELAIRGSRPPSYTVFKLQDPPRLVVDLAGADVTAVASPVQVGKGGVLAVSTAQYKDERSTVGRVIVALDGARRYEVQERGEAVVVRVLSPEASATPAALAAAPPAEPPAAPKAREVEAAAPIQAEVKAPVVAPAEPVAQAAAPVVVPAPSTPADDNVVSRRTDEAPVKHAASAVTGVKASGRGLLLATDGDVGTIDIIELRNPARLALDLHGVARAPRGAVKLDGAFGQVRFGRDASKVRVVLDVAGDLPAYQVKRVAGGIAVTPRGAATPAPSSPKPSAVAAASATVRTKPAAPPRPLQRLPPWAWPRPWPRRLRSSPRWRPRPPRRSGRGSAT